MVSPYQGPMTKLQFFRKWISFLKRARPWVDALVLVFSLGLFFFFAPLDILNDAPATGGDTGSHYWPLVTLVKEGLPNWQVRVWNPGNLGGEPHLTHYFPLPYFIMAFLSLFMPLGRAFNIGSILPVAVFPLCVYLSLRMWRVRFPIPALAALASLSFLYNESFSMWGGNALSTLAGQFAHVYANCFFILGIGAMGAALAKKRFPWAATLLFAAVLISHFYVALFLPIVFLSFLFFEKSEPMVDRLKKLALSGLGSLLLSAWFVIPMLHNSKWNTAFGLKWSGGKLLQEAFPYLFWPFAVFTVLALVYFGIQRFKKPSPEREWNVLFPMAICVFLAGFIYYFIFPPLGLVDVRVFPTMQLFLCLLAAVLAGIWMRRSMASVWVWFLAIPIGVLIFWWAAQEIHNFPYWMKWNYSGWQAKTAYPDVKNLSDKIRGDFNQGRVIYENSELSNAAGSMRVFEMLPYFSGRATLESVYMQATVLAPEAFYLQALISKTPSCPFPNYQCTGFNVDKLKNYLRMMGVSDLILMSSEVRTQADKSDFLKADGSFGLWHLYRSSVQAPLAEVLQKPPEWLETTDFKRSFYEWFLDYNPETPYQIIAPKESHAKIEQAVGGDCHPNLKVEFNQLTLETDCVGKYHILKFAFHSTWKASSEDELFLTSPGFIGLIPSQAKVVLTWGQHPLWTISNVLSWVTLLAFSGLWIFLRRKDKKR
jgi:hypothetical protein